MRIETVYIAIDGKKFSSEDVCAEHEKMLEDKYNLIKNHARFYDKDFKEVPFISFEEFYPKDYDDTDGIEDFIDSINVMNIDRNSLLVMEEFLDRYGYNNIISSEKSLVDLYIYDENVYKYVPIDNAARDAIKIVTMLNNLGIHFSIDE